MVDKINKKIKEINSFNPKSEKDIEEFRIKYLGKKGELTSLFLDFKKLALELLGFIRNYFPM